MVCCLLYNLRKRLGLDDDDDDGKDEDENRENGDMAVPENDNGFGDNGFVNRQMLINHYFAV